MPQSGGIGLQYDLSDVAWIGMRLADVEKPIAGIYTYGAPKLGKYDFKWGPSLRTDGPYSSQSTKAHRICTSDQTAMRLQQASLPICCIETPLQVARVNSALSEKCKSSRNANAGMPLQTQEV
jgi:hypothetical protein